MNDKKYLIYLDILGFEKLAGIIAEEKGITERTVRDHFIKVIKSKVEDIETKDMIKGKQYGERDSWLLVTDSLGKVFILILEILDHNTGYKDYERVPLEIAIGTGKYDRWTRFSGSDLVIENDTIKFLNTYIMNYYRTWYKKCHGRQSIKSTFIVLTESAHRELKPLDKKICQEIEYEYKKASEKKVITFFSADADKFLLRGKGLKYTEKIGYPGYEVYSRISELYVTPVEYEDIVETLEEKRIIFITGTQEFGKTYTAVRLMWDYYTNGYEPRWVKGSELAERVDVRRRLEMIESELRPGHIIYFEDPFGRGRYEKRESLEREIGRIIDKVKQIEDAYAIITSREEVFKEFEREKLSQVDIREFEQKLNIKRPSYDYEKRKHILLRWAEEEGCCWLEDYTLENFVLRAICDETVLPTPLSIRDFAIATVNVTSIRELEEIMREKSLETAKVFAEEIKSMNYDKILFLLFLFISRWRVTSIKRMYLEMVQELGSENAWQFEKLLDWFQGDKIRITRDIQMKEDILEISHPSYSEALGYLLIEDGYPTFINEKIFSKLLLRMAERGFLAGIARAVRENFNKIPQDVINRLLLKLVKSGWDDWDLAETIRENFDRLPEVVRNNVLFNLSKKKGYYTLRAVSEIIAERFETLPRDMRNVLFRLAERRATDVAWALAREENWSKLSVRTRVELLSTLPAEVRLLIYQIRCGH